MISATRFLAPSVPRDSSFREWQHRILLTAPQSRSFTTTSTGRLWPKRNIDSETPSGLKIPLYLTISIFWVERGNTTPIRSHMQQSGWEKADYLGTLLSVNLWLCIWTKNTRLASSTATAIGATTTRFFTSAGIHISVILCFQTNTASMWNRVLSAGIWNPAQRAAGGLLRGATANIGRGDRIYWLMDSWLLSVLSMNPIFTVIRIRQSSF